MGAEEAKGDVLACLGYSRVNSNSTSEAGGRMLEHLEQGTTILSATGEAFTVSEALASEFEPGDSIVANPLAGLLRIPAKERRIASGSVTKCAAAFEAMNSVTDDQIVAFFHGFAEALANDGLWRQIQTVNEHDVAVAKSKGRSTTRLAVSDAMRQNMIDGLRAWATTPSRRDAILEEIDHDGFRIELVGAALGIVAFVFEGRPNVLADACGVLRGGNTAILRIGSDALATAREIMALAVRPSLIEAGLPEHALVLIDSPAHAAGWALFLDQRLSLAVARGSGTTVDLLGSLAQSVGTPVSLHGTGGAWIVVSASVDPNSFFEAVTRSLDRKVCNTLNTCCIVRSVADQLVPVLLEALQSAGEARGASFKLHVADNSIESVPSELFETKVQIARAQGVQEEYQSQTIIESDLGLEWEWEESPEITLVVVESVDAAIDLFNEHSPRLVASLLSANDGEHKRFWDRIRSPFVGDAHTRWVDGQFALAKPELGLSNWANGRLFGRGAILTGDNIYTVRTRYVSR